ncbi:hypothetical protein RYX36_001443 [Vicia faba]
MRIQSFILIVLIVIFSSAASNHAAFLNPNDPLVNEIGNFAVNEYNKQESLHYILVIFVLEYSLGENSNN